MFLADSIIRSASEFYQVMKLSTTKMIRVEASSVEDCSSDIKAWELQEVKSISKCRALVLSIKATMSIIIIMKINSHVLQCLQPQYTFK